MKTISNQEQMELLTDIPEERALCFGTRDYTPNGLKSFQQMVSEYRALESLGYVIISDQKYVKRTEQGQEAIEDRNNIAELTLELTDDGRSARRAYLSKEWAEKGGKK